MSGKSLVESEVQDGALIAEPKNKLLLATYVPFFDGAYTGTLQDGSKMIATRESVGVVRLFFYEPDTSTWLPWMQDPDKTFVLVGCPEGFAPLVQIMRPPDMSTIIERQLGMSCWVTTFRNNQPDDTSFDFAVWMRP